MSGKIIAWVAVLLVALPSLCQTPRNRGAAHSAKNVPHPNVLLITIDTLRADHVGCYGAKSVETPTLDALAREGLIFDRAISQVPLTWPSHATILTGTYPFQNGVQDFTGHPLSPQFRTLAQAFKQSGYATGAVISSFVLDRSWGLARGFDFYDDAFSATAFQQRDLALVDRKAQQSVDHALKWLENTSKRPFFLWVHLYDPHSPYDPPEPYRTIYKDHLYDGEIAYADHELGRLIAWLKNNGAYDNSVIAFVSDHGESLGDHGEQEHGFFIYNSTIHVPLILKSPAPGRFQRGHIARPVEITAIGPTLLEMAGVTDSIKKQFQTPSLLTTEDTDQPVYSETFYPFSSFGWSPLHSLETKQYQFIEAPEPEIYDLVQDPDEKHNLLAQQPALVAVFKAKLEKTLANNPFARNNSRPGNLSPDAEQKLRALGYFAFHSSVPTESIAAGLPDPKSKIAVFGTILKAEDAFHNGADESGEILLRQVQEQDPKIYVIPYLLGESALRHQQWAPAVDQFQRCLELNPEFDNAMTGIAHALWKLGRVQAAHNWLQKATEINPANYRAWYEIGLLQAGDDPVAALASYHKAITIQPNFSPGQREVGLVLFQQKSYASAAVHLEKAIALGLDDAHIRNFLGICYSQTNRRQQSIASYRVALKLDPNLAEAHLNLGYELQRVGRIREAPGEYQAACQLEPKFCASIPK